MRYQTAKIFHSLKLFAMILTGTYSWLLSFINCVKIFVLLIMRHRWRDVVRLFIWGGNHGSLRRLHGVEILFWLWEEVILLFMLLPSEEIVVSRWWDCGRRAWRWLLKLGVPSRLHHASHRCILIWWLGSVVFEASWRLADIRSYKGSTRHHLWTQALGFLQSGLSLRC